MLSQSESESEAIRFIGSDSDSDWDSICLWFRLTYYINETKYFGDDSGVMHTFLSKSRWRKKSDWIETEKWQKMIKKSENFEIEK